MRLRENTFAKIISLIILLLIPIILLYALSMQTSIQVIKEEVRSLKQKDINFLANEFNKSIITLSSLGFLLSEDIHIQTLQTFHLIESAYERNNERLRIMERLRLLNVSQRWDTQYSIFAPSNQEFVSTNKFLSYDLDTVRRLLAPKWKYQEVITQNISQQRFVRHIVRPKNKIDNLEEAGIIVEISFPEEHIIKDLDTFKETGKGDPFLYEMNGSTIQNKSSDKTMITAIGELIKSNKLIPTSNNQIIKISNQDYLVLFAPIDTLGWYLVDYVPIDNMLQPIVKTQILFYVSVVLLLVMSLLAGYLLYRNVQRPIALLIRNVRKLQEGDYSTRIKVNPKNEFSYLFERFNDMTAETERLIEKVYMEELRLREANVKQLQSQINPHFLYNCFALIRSLARLNKTESVMNISMHLSKYYRY
ncbi:MAG TPA: histidine kinase, partial [Candidatus Paenibacillus intestinavium]|nr:histidine kinase [Candidatus Paenibacillus intestinavium]